MLKYKIITEAFSRLVSIVVSYEEIAKVTHKYKYDLPSCYNSTHIAENDFNYTHVIKL